MLLLPGNQATFWWHAGPEAPCSCRIRPTLSTAAPLHVRPRQRTVSFLLLLGCPHFCLGFRAQAQAAHLHGT